MTKGRGFTLIELLVVIAILGILAALLFPVLNSAKQRGQAVRCLNNVRQLHLGWLMYANDHNDRLACCAAGPGAGSTLENPGWVAGEMELDCDSGDKLASISTVMLVGPAYVPFGSIGGYVKNPAVYRCPADKSTVTFTNGPLPRVRSVSMNVFMGGKPGTRFRHFGRMQEIVTPSPSEAWVFIDEREDSINDGLFAVDAAARYAIIDYPGGYHNNAACLSFADGHVDMHRWLERTTQPPLIPNVRLPGGSKPTSPNDRDMIWLLEHSTSPIPQ